jgi:hypothetical protein
VRERQHIVFEYDGRPRNACPIILGYSDAGREAMKAYQVGGKTTSKSTLPAWRDFERRTTDIVRHYKMAQQSQIPRITTNEPVF